MLVVQKTGIMVEERLSSVLLSMVAADCLRGPQENQVNMKKEVVGYLCRFTIICPGCCSTFNTAKVVLIPRPP